MKLIFIHGIGQVENDPAVLTQDWIADLIHSKVDGQAIAAAQPEMAYYAKILAEGRGRIALQESASDRKARAKFGIEVAKDLGVAIHRIAANVQEGSASIPRIATGLLAANPLQGPWSLSDIIDEVFDYLTKPALRTAIDEHVATFLDDQPVTIVAHSLGTLVAYRLLRDRKIRCRRLITLGSPLSFKIVRASLDGPFSYPVGLLDWRNFFDPIDLVCLGRAFPSHPTWSPRLIHDQVNNEHDFGHDADGYLRTSEVGRAVQEALTV